MAIRLAVAVALIPLCVASCAWKRNLTDAAPTDFQGSTGISTTNKIARIPFDHAWRDPSVDPAQYSKVFILPVSLDHLRTNQWIQSMSPLIPTEKVYLDRANDLAVHFDKALARAFASPANRFATTQQPVQPGTVVIEIAITEAVFGRPGAHAASFAVTGGGVADSAMFSPTVAFEAQLFDWYAGKLIASAADRRGGRLKLVNADLFTLTQVNREICDEWAEQIMQAFNTEMFPKVKKRGPSLF